MFFTGRPKVWKYLSLLVFLTSTVLVFINEFSDMSQHKTFVFMFVMQGGAILCFLSATFSFSEGGVRPEPGKLVYPSFSRSLAKLIDAPKNIATLVRIDPMRVGVCLLAVLLGIPLYLIMNEQFMLHAKVDPNDEALSWISTFNLFAYAWVNLGYWATLYYFLVLPLQQLLTNSKNTELNGVADDE